MANVQLTALHGGAAVTLDAALIDPATEIAALTAQQLREAGTQRGTRVSPGGGVDPVDVQESVEDVKTIVRAANALGPTSSPVILGGAIFRDTGPASQTFNAAGPAVVTGLALTGLVAGGYLFSVAGTAESTDVANCGATMQVFKNGGAIGTQLAWPAPTFGGANQPAMGLGAMGMQLFDSAVPGDVYDVRIGVVPGGVGGDDITVHDVQLVAIRLS